jgi:DNA-binding MarR family transcriptional regulator
MADALPSPIPAFSPLLSQAAKDSRRLLDVLLEQAGLSFDEWICLNIAAVSGQPVETEVLCRTVAERLGCPAGQVHRAAGHLEAKELLQAGNHNGREVLGITDAGAARWHTLSRQVNATSQELVGTLDPADLAAALRVLQAVTSKAPAILARWQRTSEHGPR